MPHKLGLGVKIEGTKLSPQTSAKGIGTRFITQLSNVVSRPSVNRSTQPTA
jgi:hypothetical protein